MLTLMSVMRVFVFALILSAIGVGQGAKSAEVEVISMKAQREGDLILVDTSLKNTTTKPIKGLVAIYKFYSPSHEALSTHRTGVDEAVLEPGAASEIHAQLTAPPKAVSVEVSAQTADGHELRVQNTGPFPVE